MNNHSSSNHLDPNRAISVTDGQRNVQEIHQVSLSASLGVDLAYNGVFYVTQAKYLAQATESAARLIALQTEITRVSTEWQLMQGELLAEREIRTNAQNSVDQLKVILAAFIDADERVTPDGYMNALSSAKAALAMVKA